MKFITNLQKMNIKHMIKTNIKPFYVLYQWGFSDSVDGKIPLSEKEFSDALAKKLGEM